MQLKNDNLSSEVFALVCRNLASTFYWIGEKMIYFIETMCNVFIIYMPVLWQYSTLIMPVEVYAQIAP